MSGLSASAANWNRHWSFPLPVAPCTNVSAPTSRATCKQTLAISGRAIDVPSRYIPSYLACHCITGKAKSRQSSSWASIIRADLAPIFRAFSNIASRSSHG